MRWIITCLFFISSLTAETSVSDLFSNGMVLQRDTAVKIWGSDAKDQAITVSINGQSAQTVCDAAGTWSVQLPAMAAGGPYELSIKGSSTHSISDVYVGEVWLCSGQSNMAFPLKWLKAEASNPQTAALPQIRLFNVPRRATGEEQQAVSGTWQKADGDISNWSATAFHFGRALHEHFQVPIGLIHSAVGGTPIESWCDHKTLDSIKSIQGHVGWINGQVKKYPALKAELDKKIKAWEAGGKKGKKPTANLYAPDSPWRPAALFNGMINPLIGYTIKGAIWYQGESNAGRYAVYGETLCAMITDWRAQWGQGDFPFITVQLANFKGQPKDPQKKSSWAGLREAQNSSLSLANTGVTVCIDIGDAKDIHPKNKQDVGKRSALIARHIAYGEKLVYSGPFYQSHEIKGNEIIISFDHVAEGLKAKGDKLTAWAIAGADLAWHWADATIAGDTVVVSSPNVPEPKHVRYGWAENPRCNLYNSADLPASPFRTDTEK